MVNTLGVQVPLAAPHSLFIKNAPWDDFSACPRFNNFARIFITGMKGIKVLFAFIACVYAFAIGDAGVSYAATRRGTNSTTQTTRANIARTTTANANRNATSRNTANVQSRSVNGVKSRTATNKTSRTIGVRNTTPARTATGRNVVARVAAPTPTRESVMGANFSKCRDVYYSCMDEFCANKNSQLKRCACSARATEFDSTKKRLEKVEDKMLSFNQRLLAVNMDAGDVVAMQNSTAGEDAYNSTKDKTASKKQLDAIAKRLNTNFDTSNFNNGIGMSALTWSLNEDAAFDNVDSLAGAATTAKSGTALYAAAIPVCREMALEICTEDELSIAQNGYQMVIEQDCNTVQKAYQTQADTARQKVFESGALLDMSRLDSYQTKNSDDILTCKNKMLEMMHNSTVCGENLGKCLDVSGQYIDPSTGAAFLSVNLVNLDNLITRPTANQTWTRAPGNQVFVSFLETKKKFLEPATKNCQDIADYVWDAFLEDALAQIKLAQGKKLEEMRQSCTTLTTQCLANATQSIQDFDARALSTFGVAADLTVNAMCSNVRNACTALLNDSDAAAQWDTGMTRIATDKTYETIMHACREIGRACVIQACTSVSGNFGLCMDAEESTNRKAIIDRTACWDEVYNCVASAGTPTLTHIMDDLGKTYSEGTNFYDVTNMPNYSFYNELYGNNISHTQNYEYLFSTQGIIVQDMAYYDANDSSMNTYTESPATYRIAESIWGNCSFQFGKRPTGNGTNDIITPINNQSTILSWLANNTSEYSCTSNRCTDGYEFINGNCNPMCQITFAQSGTSWISDITGCNSTNSTCQTADYDCCPTDRMTPSASAPLMNCCSTNKIVTTGTTSVCCNNNIGTTTIDNNLVSICAPTNNSMIQVITDLTSLTGCSGTADLICFGTYFWDADTGTAICNGSYVYRCRADGKITAAVTSGTTYTGTYYEPNYFCYAEDAVITNGDCQLGYILHQ